MSFVVDDETSSIPEIDCWGEISDFSEHFSEDLAGDSPFFIAAPPEGNAGPVDDPDNSSERKKQMEKILKKVQTFVNIVASDSPMKQSVGRISYDPGTFFHDPEASPPLLPAIIDKFIEQFDLSIVAAIKTGIQRIIDFVGRTPKELNIVDLILKREDIASHVAIVCQLQKNINRSLQGKWAQPNKTLIRNLEIQSLEMRWIKTHIGH